MVLQSLCYLLSKSFLYHIYAEFCTPSFSLFSEVQQRLSISRSLGILTISNISLFQHLFCSCYFITHSTCVLGLNGKQKHKPKIIIIKLFHPKWLYSITPLSVFSSPEMKTLMAQKVCFSIWIANAQIQSEVKWCHKSIAPTLYIFSRLHRRPDWISLLHAFNKHNIHMNLNLNIREKKKKKLAVRPGSMKSGKTDYLKWNERREGEWKGSEWGLTGWVLRGTVLHGSMKYRFLIILKAEVKWVGGKYLIWKISLH